MERRRLEQGSLGQHSQLSSWGQLKRAMKQKRSVEASSTGNIRSLSSIVPLGITAAPAGSLMPARKRISPQAMREAAETEAELFTGRLGLAVVNSVMVHAVDEEIEMMIQGAIAQQEAWNVEDAKDEKEAKMVNAANETEQDMSNMSWQIAGLQQELRRRCSELGFDGLVAELFQEAQKRHKRYCDIHWEALQPDLDKKVRHKRSAAGHRKKKALAMEQEWALQQNGRFSVQQSTRKLAVRAAKNEATSAPTVTAGGAMHRQHRCAVDIATPHLHRWQSKADTQRPLARRRSSSAFVSGGGSMSNDAAGPSKDQEDAIDARLQFRVPPQQPLMTEELLRWVPHVYALARQFYAQRTADALLDRQRTADKELVARTGNPPLAAESGAVAVGASASGDIGQDSTGATDASVMCANHLCATGPPPPVAQQLADAIKMYGASAALAASGGSARVDGLKRGRRGQRPLGSAECSGEGWDIADFSRCHPSIFKALVSEQCTPRTLRATIQLLEQRAEVEDMFADQHQKDSNTRNEGMEERLRENRRSHVVRCYRRLPTKWQERGKRSAITLAGLSGVVGISALIMFMMLM